MNREPLYHVLLLMAVMSVTHSAHAQFSPDALLADRLLGPDGHFLKGMTIHLAHGKIKSVQPGHRFKASQHVVRHENAVVFPGLIDVRSRLGTYGHSGEMSHAIDPAANAMDLTDTGHRDFAHVLRAGVTTVMISPADHNLVSGAAVVVKTKQLNGIDPVLRADGPLMMAFGSTVLQYDRAPTSRIGSMSMMRDVASDAAAGRGHVRLQHFLAGKLDAVIVCEALEDIRSVTSMFGDTRARFSIVHSSELQDTSAVVSDPVRRFVVGPFGFDSPPANLVQAGVIAKGGVPVAIAGGSPAGPHESLRIGANLAVRYGMDPAKARLAITTTAAEVAGVRDRVGAIRPGFDADLVVFSDDPLRLDARILEVYVNGVRVYQDLSSQG